MVGEKGKLESVASGIEADAGGRMEVWAHHKIHTHLLQSWTKLQSVPILAGPLPTELKSQSSL